MKFLIVTNHSYMLWQFRHELIQELTKLGEVVISTPFVGHEADFEALGCRMIETRFERRGMNPLKDIKLFRQYKEILNAEKPDLVITYSIKPNIYAGFACKELKIPYAVNVQGLGSAFQEKATRTLVSIMYKAALSKAETVFFENQETEDLFTEDRIIKKEKATQLAGAGVNLQDYPFRPYPEQGGAIRFLYLGRIMREKGISELIEALIEIKALYGDTVAFDFVGFYEDDYKETIDGLAKDGYISFYGFQEDPRPFYTAAHCIVLPSYHEGMSNVLLEAAAIGRPLITSDIPGCREAVDEGQNGFLVEPRSSSDLLGAMQRFMELSYDAKAEMGRCGRTIVEERFDKTAVVRETLKALRLA